jgi:hypothetical protein
MIVSSILIPCNLHLTDQIRLVISKNKCHQNERVGLIYSNIYLDGN